ncbi:hypothetical protein OHW01_12205 [Acinetobacter baumannii]|uniref:hypothetical protein n=1 Tax=Acinetobacter baumannii TaxID=470 RepID=UPI00148E2422|nr:hypothetical protein [Acinetobacter baumannii]MDC4261930.1 hypothetical protein [Acinetobacter baumannii]MDC4876412.1 hypothetical protein [Acinetobacter baumannii]MDC4885186.1 hypothetical protein [Acinetobacter baumannii]MDC4925688.1 hypothetical protein [Acinetobacter baumannii]MDC4938799.1 hypothetical protein [Acinetobacter baumannii]
MKKYFPELDIVSDILDLVPHPQIQSIAHAIRVCNDEDTHFITKLRAVVGVMI